VKPYGLLLAVGIVLLVVVWWVGGAVALAAQLGAVALLRPAMEASHRVFMARWLGGMAIRVLSLGGLLAVAATHRAALPLLATTLGFLGVLLPLLFLEIRFLK
jgi:C4-dicarboxylate transporter